eukprot:scaffold52990_cov42-Phaeocystis_antarctica.AAC.2
MPSGRPLGGLSRATSDRQTLQPRGDRGRGKWDALIGMVKAHPASVKLIVILFSDRENRTLWSTYDQLKLNLAGLAARRVTLWSCWAPRVPRLQVSRGATELLVSYRTDPPTRQVRTKGRRLMCRIRRARGL